MADIAADGEDRSVRARLIAAADAEMTERGSTDVPMAAIAERAGVSRATAFRQLGSVAETVTQVALRHSRLHIARVHALMDGHTGAFSKLEAALLYTSRELPTDPTISSLIARHSASVRDPQVHAVALAVMGPVIADGQRTGEIRSDLEVDEILDYLVEQSYLAAEDAQRSDDNVRRRLRHFIAPAIAARGDGGGQTVSVTNETKTAAQLAALAIANLLGHLERTTGSDGDRRP